MPRQIFVWVIFLSPLFFRFPHRRWPMVRRWGLTMLLGAVWAGGMLWAIQSAPPTGIQRGLYALIEHQMFLWDEMHGEGAQLPIILRQSIAAQTIPVRMRDYLRRAEARPGLVDQNLWGEYALACHRFAADLDDPIWQAEEERVLGLLDNRYPVNSAILSALYGEEISKDDYALLMQRDTGPIKWWKAELRRIRRLGEPKLDEHVTQRRLSSLYDAIALLFLTYVGPLILLILGGSQLRRLVCPAPPLAPSAGRLFRLWPARRILNAVFGIHAAVFLLLVANGLWVGKYIHTIQSYIAINLLHQFVLALLTVILLKWTFTRHWGVLRRSMGFTLEDLCADSNWTLGFATVGLVLISYIVWYYFALWTGAALHSLDGLARYEGDLGTLGWPYRLIMACLLAPFWEEIVFRGFLFGGLRTHWGPGWAAVISSFLFAYIHGYGASGTVIVFFIGLLACLLYHRSRKLAASMYMHGMMNLMAILVQILTLGHT